MGSGKKIIETRHLEIRNAIQKGEKSDYFVISDNYLLQIEMVNSALPTIARLKKRAAFPHPPLYKFT